MWKEVTNAEWMLAKKSDQQGHLWHGLGIPEAVRRKELIMTALASAMGANLSYEKNSKRNF